MDYVRLGRTGLNVSRLCLGGMSFGSPGWPPHPWVMGREDAQPFFRLAAERGINFFDTADHYSFGVGEEILGEALRTYFPASDVVVATKVGLRMGDGPNDRGLSRKRIIESVEGSLRRLDRDHIDILYTHRFDPNTEIEEIVTALDQVVRQGKVHYLGACSSWAWQFAQIREIQKANGLATFAVMQNLYNLVYREEEREMIPYCTREGVAIVPWSPIARGFLAAPRPKAATVASGRASQDKVLASYFGSSTDYEILDAVQRQSKRLRLTMAQVAYALVMSKSFIAAPIVGADTLPQLEDAIGALDVALDQEAIADLESRYRPRSVLGELMIAGGGGQTL